MTYTKYELSDQHMRGIIGDTNTHPVLRKVRKEPFDAWLEAHDRRVFDLGYEAALAESHV